MTSACKALTPAVYAELLGRSKAKLMLRYAAQMGTPNSQNMLIEFDQNMNPTGRLVFRDTILIEAVAEGLGESEVLTNDKKIGVENGKSIQPYWSNSAWRFDKAGSLSVSANALSDCRSTHDQAYKAEIENALGVDLSAFQTIDNNLQFNLFMV